MSETDAALPSSPISQAAYNEALLTIAQLYEVLKEISALNKSAEGWTYSQEIEDVLAAALAQEKQ